MKSFSILVSFVVIAGSSHAAIYTNSFSADAFVRAAAPTLNYGGAGSLSVSGSSSTNGSGAVNGIADSFIRFNTAAMVATLNSTFGSNNWTINGARLRVVEQGAPMNTIFTRGKGAFEIRWIANTNWIEGTGMPMTPNTSGISYNDGLALLNGGTDVSLGTFTNAGIDFTNTFLLALPATFISAVKSGSDVGLYFTAIDPGVGFTFNSRSFTTVSARPFLEISAVPTPGNIAITLSGTDVVLAGTNGAVGGTYYILGSTNVGLPLNQWLPVVTNVLTANGEFTITVTNAANANAPSEQFFILQTR